MIETSDPGISVPEEKDGRKRRRILLTVAYDGTAYCGFQIQDNGITIQEVLNRTLSEWLEEDIRISAASRTDAGVCARGNLAVFDTFTRIPGEKYAFGLNTRLPEDIRIQGSMEVPSSFHPRFARTVKNYKYRILNRTFPDPLRRTGYHFCYHALDEEKMNRAAQALAGERDFASFAAAGHEAATTVRTITEISVAREGEVLTLSVTGNGFLYNMVRIIAGTLMEIGKGNLEEDCIPAILAARDRKAAGPTAPAAGLTLEWIHYPDGYGI